MRAATVLLAAADTQIAEAEQLLGTLSKVLKAASGVNADAASVLTGIETAHEALALARRAPRACDIVATGEAA